VWQPNRAQWSVLWAVAVAVILAWPPDSGRSLGVKAVNWAADPAGGLPALPPPLPMSLGDNGDAVAAHDALETAYYQARDRSLATRWRMDLKTAGDPLERSTMRQLLVGLGVLSALAMWRLSPPRRINTKDTKDTKERP
jgi:hypothetical protein